MNPLPSHTRPRTCREPLLRWMVVAWTVMTLFAARPGVGAPYVILKDGDRRIDAQWIKHIPNGDILVITAEGKTRFRREDLKELHIDPPEHWIHSTHRPLNTNMVEFIEANPWVKHETELASLAVSILALQKKGVEATAFAGEVMRANEEARTNTTFQAAYWQALLAADRRAELSSLLEEAIRTGTPTAVAHAQACLGDLQVAEQRPEAAIEAYLRAAILGECEPDLAAKAILKAAQTMESGPTPERAAALYQRVVSEYPTSPSAYAARQKTTSADAVKPEPISSSPH